MSQAVRGPVRYPRTREGLAGRIANVTAAAEVTARGLVDGVQAICVVVREYPVLSVFLASGIGYLLGRARGSVSARQAARPNSNSSDSPLT